MNFNGLRLVIQQFKGASRFVQLRKNVKSYRIPIAVKNVPIISSARDFHHLGRIEDRSSTNGTRCYATDKCAKNKFDPSCIDPSLAVTFADIEALPQHPEVLLIDVRNPEELQNTGVIPTSINIPLKSVKQELQISAEDFETKYGRKKPETDSPLIFSCLGGVRAGMAANTADKLGFTNVKSYPGSWADYAERKGLKKQ